MGRADGLAALTLGWQRLERFATLPTQSAGFVAALAETMLAGVPVRLFEAAGVDGVEALLPLCHGADRWAGFLLAGNEDAIARRGAVAASGCIGVAAVL